MRRGLSGVIAVVAVVALSAAACGNAKDDASSTTTTANGGSAPTSGGKYPAVDQPGVTADAINVGGVTSKTNPLGGNYADAFVGVQAYFDMVNSQGGVYGRKLKITEKRDDAVSNNKAEADALIADQNIFAILPVASLLFTGGNDIAKSGVPTFGWNINNEWSGTPADPRLNMFGQTGSFRDITAAKSFMPVIWIAQHLKATKLGVLAYTVDQSKDCAKGIENAVATYGPKAGVKIAFTDQALSFGTTDMSSQVSKMKEAGVNFVTTCMDTNGVVTLAKEMKKQQLDAKQYLPNGYDDQFLKQYGDLFEGSVVRTDFTPWQLPKKDQPAGLQQFLKWMDGNQLNENAMAGWLNAALFVKGLQDAGPDFTRQKVIDSLNKLTAFDADRVIHPVDWTKSHTQDANPTEGCDVVSTIKSSAYVPNYSEPGKPFHCVQSKPDGTMTANNQA
jgi:ABC-type branched-subunit amino acid transport system substrate-binding protein